MSDPTPHSPQPASDSPEARRVDDRASDSAHGELLPRRDHALRTGTRIALLGGGLGLVAGGILLSVLPIVPGWPLTLVGLGLVASAHEPSRRLINWGDRKLPGPIRRGLRWARDHSPFRARADSTDVKPSADAEKPSGDDAAR